MATLVRNPIKQILDKLRLKANIEAKEKMSSRIDKEEAETKAQE